MALLKTKQLLAYFLERRGLTLALRELYSPPREGESGEAGRGALTPNLCAKPAAAPSLTEEREPSK